MTKEKTFPPRGENKAHSRRCESLIENAFDVIAVVDADFNILYASPSTFAVLGYRPEETVGWDGVQLAHPEDRSRVRKVREKLIRNGGRSAPGQLRLRHQNGEWRIVEMIAQNLLEDPNVGGIVLNWRDVTECRRIEERYEKSFSCNPDSVTITRREDGRFLVANEGFELHSGFTSDEVSEKSIYDLQFWKRPADRERLMKQLEENRSVRNFEAEFVIKGGEVKTGLVSAEVIELEQEPCVLTVIRDITDIKLTEKRLRETAERLAEEREEVVRKNVALNEVLKHLEHEKTVFRHEVSANLENLLRPLIADLETAPGKLTSDDIDKIRAGLQRVLGEEIDDFQNNLAKLTPRELDVCDLVKNGHSTKEIADKLNVSSETIQKHRQSIRKKLQIDRRGLSLASYLRTRM
jgi:PAS domain S-box-containing protein